jgi:pyruvate,orthophosphate dikinase
MAKTTKSTNSAAPKKGKYVYTFGAAKADGDGKMKSLLGGKGANLAEMTHGHEIR